MRFISGWVIYSGIDGRVSRGLGPVVQSAGMEVDVQEWHRAIQLIETALAASIDIDRLAQVALASEYHFRRMFGSLAGSPVSECIRQQRLTVATTAILAGRTVLQVAIRYVYG